MKKLTERGTPMTLYRIYTENKDAQTVCRLVSARFNGYTLYYGTGYWNGVPERNLTVEILTKKSSIVRALAGEIRTALGQEAVLIVSIPCESELVTG